MMQESPDPEDDESPSQSDLSMLSQDLHALKRSGSNTSYEDREYTAVVVGVCYANNAKLLMLLCSPCGTAVLFHTLLPFDEV